MRILLTEFVSAGPKNYAYKLNNGETKAVVKGFLIDKITSLNLNFETIKRIVTEDITQKIKVKQLSFKRNKTKWEIISEMIDKEYGFVYDKRALFEDFSTLPFGY